MFRLSVSIKQRRKSSQKVGASFMGGPEGGSKLLKFTKKWRQVSLEVWKVGASFRGGPESESKLLKLTKKWRHF